jgi:tetratricopeptide (TPR) repeat protein
MSPARQPMRALITAATLWTLMLASPATAAWFQIQSEHYLFIGDASRGDMQRLATRFEQFHAAMRQVLSRATFSASAPTIVLILKDRRSLQQVLPLDEGKPVLAAGYAVRAVDFNFVAIDASGGEQAFPVVFHELTHVFTTNVWRNLPDWLAEGVAEYFSTFELRSTTDMRIGTPIGRHVGLLRQRMMPVGQLLTLSDVTSILDERQRSNLFYAQSWALFHWLYTKPGAPQRFSQYMKMVDEGTPQESAFAEAFGTDLVTLQQELTRYVHQFQMLAMQLTLRERISPAALVAVEIPERVVAPFLADLQYRVSRIDEAEARAKAIVAQSPQSAAGHALLASQRVREDKPQEAAALLNRPLSFDGFVDHYMVAFALARYLSAVDSDAADVTWAQRAFREHILEVTRLRPDVAEAWQLAARAHLIAGDVDPAAAAIERALGIAPARESYRFTLAEVFARKREFTAARDVLGVLLAHGRTKDVRDEARRIMGEVVNYERALQRSAGGPAPTATELRSTVTDAITPADAAKAERPVLDPPRVIPTFRVVGPDERQVFGSLTAIECHTTGVSLLVNVAGIVRRFTAPDFDRIEFITFRDDLKGQVTCGGRDRPDAVYVTWRGSDTGAAEIVAPVIIVEFTPLGYKPG